MWHLCLYIRDVEWDHKGGREDTEARDHDSRVLPGGGSDHEEATPWQTGAAICRGVRGAHLHCHWIHGPRYVHRSLYIAYLIVIHLISLHILICGQMPEITLLLWCLIVQFKSKAFFSYLGFVTLEGETFTAVAVTIITMVGALYPTQWFWCFNN